MDFKKVQDYLKDNPNGAIAILGRAGSDTESALNWIRHAADTVRDREEYPGIYVTKASLAVDEAIEHLESALRQLRRMQ